MSQTASSIILLGVLLIAAVALPNIFGSLRKAVKK
jgi:hypothetical protein